MSTAAIPYTVEIRPDTGLNNVKLGIWLFLASEVMLFGSLFASYILLRTGNPAWGAGEELLSVPLATLNTAVLITSSVYRGRISSTSVSTGPSSTPRNMKTVIAMTMKISRRSEIRCMK